MLSDDRPQPSNIYESESEAQLERELTETRALIAAYYSSKGKPLPVPFPGIKWGDTSL